jgi:hypothetical protein
MPLDCSAVSRAPEFKSEFRVVANNEWHATDDVTSCNTCRRRRATFLHCYDVMEFRSDFWCSRNCSSTMMPFPGSALRVIWADQHPRSCDISFVHFRIFFIKTPIRVWLKASETSFPRKGIPWGHFAWFWKGLHVYFFQIVVFAWRINACRVCDKYVYH